jgi:hypothetical protein
MTTAASPNDDLPPVMLLVTVNDASRAVLDRDLRRRHGTDYPIARWLSPTKREPLAAEDRVDAGNGESPDDSAGAAHREVAAARADILPPHQPIRTARSNR